jgi:hypothetical protein
MSSIVSGGKGRFALYEKAVRRQIAGYAPVR